jgi:nucleoid-associated protein YgaU
VTTRVLRRIAVLSATAALVLSSVAGPAAGHALKGGSKAERLEHARSHVAQAKARQAAKKAAHGKAAKKAAQRAKVAAKKAAARERAAAKRAAARARQAAAKARYAVNGTLVDVDGAVLTVDVKGGNRQALHGTTRQYTVAGDARISRDGAPATLDDLTAGDHVTVHGSDLTGLVTKVNATSPDVVDEAGGDPVVDDPAQP